jgi:hypothetical protein
MLIFGKHNFRIKTYTPFELELSKNPDQGFNIEVRQNYFHLLGIPCFDMGITWHIRKGPSLTPMPVPYKEQINMKKFAVNTPWRTFTLPFLIMLGCVAYNVNDVLERRQANLKIEEKAVEFNQIPNSDKPDISANDVISIEKQRIDSLSN